MVALRFKPTKIELKEAEALIRFRAPTSLQGAGTQVIFKSDFVLSVMDTWEKIDLRPKTLLYEINGKLADGSSCSLMAEFVVGIPDEVDSVLRAAGTFGVERASSQEALRENFHFRLVEAVQTALSTSTAEAVTKEKEAICEALMETTSVFLGDCGFQMQSADIRQVRFHKKAGKAWT
jgi:uncharacterized membrane protein YqiK